MKKQVMKELKVDDKVAVYSAHGRKVGYVHEFILNRPEFIKVRYTSDCHNIGYIDTYHRKQVRRIKSIKPIYKYVAAYALHNTVSDMEEDFEKRYPGKCIGITHLVKVKRDMLS